MRCWVHLCLLVGSGGLIAAEPEPLPRDRPLNILIVGNSFVNLLADQVDLAALAASAGLPRPNVVFSRQNGARLIGRLAKAEVAAMADGGWRGQPWDCLILQEQSLTPVSAEVDPAARKAFLDGVGEWYDRVRAKHPRCRVMLLETWSRHAEFWRIVRVAGQGGAVGVRNVGQPVIDRYLNAPGAPEEREQKLRDELRRTFGADAVEQQAWLRKWYRHAAEVYLPQHNPLAANEPVLIAPVGDAFERHYAQTDAPRLQGADNYHPVLAGAYLEAAVLFGAMYGLPPTNITAGPAKGSLPAALASRLRQTASDTLGFKPPAP